MEITSMTNMFYFVVNTANKIQRTIDIVLLKKIVLTSPGATTLGFNRAPGVVLGTWTR